MLQVKSTPIDKENPSQLKIKKNHPIQSTPSISQASSKRRALGDVLNVQRAALPSTPCVLNKSNPGNTIEKCLERDNEEIDLCHKYVYDSFSDIMSDSQKLSTLLLNAKCVPRMPTGYENSQLFPEEEKYHTFSDIMSDKKFKKLMKSAPFECKPVELRILDLNAEYELLGDLIAPSSDW